MEQSRMQGLKTHFEQIPIAEVKKIAKKIHDDVAGNNSAVATTSPSKLKPHRLASLGKKRKAGLTMQLDVPKINCSICDKPLALESAKTDEVGQAIHDECYLLKIGKAPFSDPVHSSTGKMD
jgi:hypothetical protein